MAMGIFEQLAWLTKKVKQLCCIVENGGGGGCGDCPVAVNGTTITGNGTIANPLVATINPTDTVIPFNNGGVLGDSIITNQAGGPGIVVAGYVDVSQYYVTNVYAQEGIDASGGFSISNPGVYVIDTSATGGTTLDFPDPGNFIGAEIFIVINNATNCDLGGFYIPESVTQGVSGPLANLKGKYTYIFKSTGTVWYGGYID